MDITQVQDSSREFVAELGGSSECTTHNFTLSELALLTMELRDNNSPHFTPFVR
jgi:hypothetical protein